MRASRSRLLIGFAALGIASGVSAQTPPPIHGVTGTLATEGTIKSEQKAANKIAVATEDGVEHVYDAAKDLLVHGGKSPLADLRPGTTVIVHYTVEEGGALAREIDRVGDEGLKVTEGTVTAIDRGKKEITVRYDGGVTEKLQLTDRAAVDAGLDIRNAPPGTTRIVLYYSDEAGRKIAHYFKRKS
jgi:hypothetical protein